MVAYNYLSVSFMLAAGLEMPGGIPGIAAPLIAFLGKETAGFCLGASFLWSPV